MKLTKHNLHTSIEQVYDTIVVGGGVGGLSAGIYLQRYLLNTLIIDIALRALNWEHRRWEQ